MQDAIKAGKHFKVEEWSALKHAAMNRLLEESEINPEYWDVQMINKICKRFKLGNAFAFYSHNRDLWFS